MEIRLTFTRQLNRCLLIGIASISAFVEASPPTIHLSCKSDNDLFRVLRDMGYPCKRYDHPEAAVESASPGSGVLLLADDYPEHRLSVNSEIYARAQERKLRLFIEYPSFVPGLILGSEQKTVWERMVVSTTRFGSSLPSMQIFQAHDCHYLPVTSPDPLVVIAKVAGYNEALFGLPTNSVPALFAINNDQAWIATTRLSNFRAAHFAPTREWTALWNQILLHLTSEEWPGLKWTPVVHPQYSVDQKLPRAFEKNTFRTAARWHRDSELLVSEPFWKYLEPRIARGEEVIPRPRKSFPVGDGRWGVLEGYASNIDEDGDHLLRTPVRADCQAETAMVLALDWALNRNARSREIASNLLDFTYYKSELCGGVRGNPMHPAYGLVSWGGGHPAWRVANYGDDNARVFLGTMLAAACLGSDRWDEPLLRGLLANLRTTGKFGFRGDRIDIGPLEQHGWKHYHDAATVNYSPHFEAYLWTCYLWAYQRTGHTPFLDLAKSGIRMMMEAYPSRWRWDDNVERVHMLMTLAWLVRVADTPEARHWLHQIAEDLIALQDVSGAIRERFRGSRGSHYQVPKSNEAYGTGETPLLQQNGDPVSDQLYVTGFALIGFREANSVIRDPRLQSAEDKLAEFLCRIQIDSPQIKYLHGAWYRAFDFKRWDFWATSGDIGWGAWCIESGWGQTWTSAALGIRLMKSSMWDLTQSSQIGRKMEMVQQQLSRTPEGPWKPTRTQADSRASAQSHVTEFLTLKDGSRAPEAPSSVALDP